MLRRILSSPPGGHHSRTTTRDPVPVKKSSSTTSVRAKYPGGVVGLGYQDSISVTTSTDCLNPRKSYPAEYETEEGPIPATMDISVDYDPAGFIRQRRRTEVLQEGVDDLNSPSFAGNRISLFGLPGSGKSSILKHLRNEYFQSAEYLQSQTGAVRDTMIDLLQFAVETLAKANEDVVIVGKINDIVESLENFSDFDMQELKLLSQDPAFLKLLDKNIPDISTNVTYFMGNYHRIRSEEITHEDLLLSHITTITKDEQIFSVDHNPILVQDFGGRRYQRLQWPSEFGSDLNALVYVHSLTSYDLPVEEDLFVNQMEESLVVFEEIANHEFLKDVPLILIFTKKDLLQSKLEVAPFGKYWTEYKGSNTPQAVMNYIKSIFILSHGKSDRPFYVYFVNTVDQIQGSALVRTILTIGRHDYNKRKVT